MSYVSGSEGPSVSGYDVQGPKPLSANHFPSATAVSESVVTKNPNGVILQGSGSYHFKYDCTTAEGSALAAGTIPSYGNTAFSSGVIEVSEDDSTLQLPISPCAWSGSGAGKKSVTFVYKGGL